MKDFFMSLSDRGKLLLLTFTLSFVTLLIAFLTGGLMVASFVVLPAIVSFLTVTKEVWASEGGSGKGKIQLASLGIAVLAVGMNEKFKPVVDPLLAPLLDQFPGLRENLPSSAPSVIALVFLLLVIFIVNYFAQDRTVMKEHGTPIEKEFPEREYKDALKLFTGSLLNDLRNIDIETNWNAATYTPLDAEVEVQSGTKRLKKVTDLLSAIRADRRSRVFLVLGDPGSGKSVALRKLCQTLLDEVTQTRRVPIYVNLKEWEPREPWSEKNPPTVEQVYDFVLDNLKSRTDVFAHEFLDKYFKKMFDKGYLFIVIDSFDEIPAVLDVSEDSWLIDKLSEVLYKFLAGAHESRGILASRIFRRPTGKFDTKTTLEIRPFTESKIVESLKKSLAYNENLVRQLFNERQELVPIARNPFTAALISDYIKNNNNILPSNQAELYSSYIMRRLASSKARMQEHGLTVERVLECATEMADVMFTTEYLGLEAPIKELKTRLPRQPVEEVVDLLKFARLGRLGGGNKRRFSFVHRRFNEYFVVRRFREQPDKVPTDSIPMDSRWRDALVLYCEVAEEERAREIAEFCWSEVVKISKDQLDMSSPQYLRSIHCLRFLKEAFRARLQCIDSFRTELARFIDHQIQPEQNLIALKLTVEAVGLLKPVDIDAAIIKALNINNQWIDETALKSCHYLPRLSTELNKKLIFFIDSIGMQEFLWRRKEIMFSLKLSNIFIGPRRFCTWRLLDFCGILLAAVAAIILNPILFLFMLLTVPVIKAGLSSTFSEFKSSSVSRYWNIILNRPFMSTMLLFPCLIPFRTVYQFLEAGESLPNATYQLFLLPAMAFAVPWYEVVYYSPDIFRKLRLRHLGYAIMFIVVVGMVGFGMGRLLQLIPEWIVLVLGFAAVSFAVIDSVKAGFRYFKYTYQDRQRFRMLQPNATLTRQQISEQFYGFKTDKWRLKYVQSLQGSRISTNSQWPDGKIPTVNHDEASTLLARLEEKWLGLDR